MVVAPLDRSRSRLPDLYRPILGTGHHPFALAVKSNAGNVTRMALECQQRIWVRGLDVVEFDVVVAGSGEEALIGGDTEAVDLRVWVLDRARADAGESLPKSDGMVVTRCLPSAK